MLRPNSQSYIVSVDLQEMSPIPGVTILQGDITSPDTAVRIIESCGNELADIVVCDGAPDVTGLHDLDEYIQFQLILSALQITRRILRRGGTFVSKVFRGENIDLLIEKMKLFFPWDKIFIAKPRSSRNASVECFLVARDYNAAREPPPRLLLLPPDNNVSDKANKRSDDGACLVKFLACGDLSVWDDADVTYMLSEDYVSKLPVQPPINPAYKESIDSRRGCSS